MATTGHESEVINVGGLKASLQKLKTDIIDEKYEKPSGGIPDTDLSSGVQTSLGKADTALQSHQSKADLGLDNVTNDAQVKRTEMGVANGVATLDESGIVPSTQLPSYVDDVIDLLAISATAPEHCAKGDLYFNTTTSKVVRATGTDTWGTSSATNTDPEKSKIYVNLSDDKTYRWSGSTMVATPSSDFTGIKVGSSGSTLTPSQGVITIPEYETGAQVHIAPTTAEVKSALNTVTTSQGKYLKDDGTWDTPQDTTYESKQAAEDGTDLSLVTTGEKYDWNNKAEQDGEYMDLVAGNIVGEFTQEANVSFRPSAGSTDILTGYQVSKGGHLEGIKGNTVAWNQLVKMPTSSSQNGWILLQGPTYNTDGSFTIHPVDDWAGGCFDGYNAQSNHLYYVSFDIQTNDIMRVFFGGVYIISYAVYTQRTAIKDVITAIDDTIFQLWGTANVPATLWDIQIIDLTLIYGAGNEPSTAAAFEADYLAWFGKPLSYEAYDAGSLRPVKMAGLKTIGFNALDMSKFPLSAFINNGSFSISGDEVTLNVSGTDCYMVNVQPLGDTFDASEDGMLIEVLPNTTYHFHATNENFCKNYIQCWDADKNCIGSFENGGVYWGSQDINFTTLPNCHYVNFRLGTGDNISSGSYTTKICINLSHSGARDGEYEPYWTSTLNVPVTTMTGKLNGEGSSVVVFPDGLKKAGNVYDEIVKVGNITKAIKRVGSVDMGTLIYAIYENNGLYYGATSSITDRNIINGNVSTPLGLYTREQVYFGELGLGVSSGDGDINVGLSSRPTTNEGYQEALSGVMLYYELETPEEYILDDFELPQEYDVDDYGTEEVIAPTGQITVAPKLSLRYGINAPDSIRNLHHNFVSATQEQDFTEAQKLRARKNIGINEDTYAKPDGEYPELVAGNLIGKFDQEDSFIYRPSAGSTDIEADGKVDYGGSLKAIKGNTVAWNQLVQNGDFSDGTTGWGVDSSHVTASVSDGIYTFTKDEDGYDLGCIRDFDLIESHVYFCRLFIKASAGIFVGTNGFTAALTTTGNGWEELNGFVAEVSANRKFGVGSYAASTIQVRDITLFDLTLIYGAGNEPSTAAAFEADYFSWFGKPLTYEAYDEGSLRPVMMAGIKTVGFNQWDEQWESGYLGSSGSPYEDNNSIRSKNFMDAFPNASYYLCASGSFVPWVYWFDANKSFISRYEKPNGGVVTSPANACFFKLSLFQYGSTYNHDICINLSHSGVRNGEYEPYWESTLPIPLTSITGKKDGMGESVVVFPDGMKKAGTVYDEIVRRGNQTVAIKRIHKQVFNGTETFRYLPEYDVWYLYLESVPKYGYQAVMTKYPFVGTYTNLTNKTCSFFYGTAIALKDSDVTDLSSAQAAMKDVIIYFELETPEEYVLDFNLPQSFKDDDWGTEEVLSVEGHVSSAPKLTIEYGENVPDAVRNLPRNYVSATQEQVFTDAQKARARRNIGAITSGDMPSSLPANGGNADTVDGEHASAFLHKSGDSMNGTLNMSGSYNITNLPVGGGLYWNPYVESSSDSSDGASIHVDTNGVAGGTTLVIEQENDANDTIQFRTNTNATLYHNSYPVITGANIGSQSVNYATTAGAVNYSGVGYTVNAVSNSSTTVSLAGTTPLHVVTTSVSITAVTLSANPPEGHSCHVIFANSTNGELTVALTHDSTNRVCPGGTDPDPLTIPVGGYVEVDFLAANNKVYVRGV